MRSNKEQDPFYLSKKRIQDQLRLSLHKKVLQTSDSSDAFATERLTTVPVGNEVKPQESRFRQIVKNRSQVGFFTERPIDARFITNGSG